jgi:hypothetical protein
MGNAIVYCSRCQNRLLSGDFENRKAVWSQEKPYCAACILAIVATLPPEEEQRVREQLAVKRSTAGSEAPPRGAGRDKSSQRMAAVKAAPPVPKTSPPARRPFILAGAGTLLIGAVALVFLPRDPGPTTISPPSSSSPTPAVEIPAAAPKSASVVDPPPARPPSRREEAARKALQKAREYGRANAADLPGRIALLEEATVECRGTSLAAEARKEYESAQQQRVDSVAAELVPAAGKARDAAANGRYGDAIALLQKELPRLAGADWTAAVEREILQIRQAADHAFVALREKALRARRSGAEDEAAAVLDQIAGWGLEELTARLRTELAAIPKPEKVLPPEARAYSASWDKAFSLARARDHAAAVHELETAATLLTDPALKAESATDLELLRFLAAAHVELLQMLVRSTKGQKLSVEADGPTGKPLRVDGTVLRTTPTWMELRTESETVAVDYDDLTPASLRELIAKVPGRKPESSARAGALFLLLEGEPSGLPPDALPARIVAYGARVAQERSRPEAIAREAAARNLFEMAERDFNDPGTKLDAYDRYRALLASHGDSVFVRRKRSFVAQRLGSEKEAGREYVIFADQMKPVGVFRLVAYPKAAAAWTSASDVPPEKDNYVDVAFSAKPATEYHCWIYAGGCCAETFTFDVQGTEMGAEPGGPQRIPVKNTINYLKKTHALHGGRKEPTRFEWIAIPLPKYGSGGSKTVRLCSGQQGFSVAYAFVSSTRTIAPSDPMAREWERSRLPVRAASPQDASLVGWWTLDDGAGTTAFDSSLSRMPGTLRNGPVWTSGKRRGALGFDGVDDFVEIPKDPRLYIPGPFTVAAWVYLTGAPKSAYGMYVFSDYGLDGNHSTFALSIHHNRAPQFFWQHDRVAHPRAVSPTPLALETWAHLAGVWDGTTRTLYVNGTSVASEATPQPRADIGHNTAIGRPGVYHDPGMYFNGRIDDVRIYNRALSSMEIQSLAGR